MRNRIILFGAGRLTNKFLLLYKDTIKLNMVVDNEDIINFQVGNGTHYFLHRTSTFLKNMPTGQIVETRACQDMQIALIMTYKTKCGFIDEYEGVYFRPAHSHSRVNLTGMLSNVLGYLDAGLETLKEMHIPDEEYNVYKKILTERYWQSAQDILIQIWLKYSGFRMPTLQQYVIFGAGGRTKNLMNLLGNEWVSYIVDNNSALWGTAIMGIEICSPSRVKKTDKVLITVSGAEEEIYAQLRDMQIPAASIVTYEKFLFSCIDDDIHRCIRDMACS